MNGYVIEKPLSAGRPYRSESSRDGTENTGIIYLTMEWMEYPVGKLPVAGPGSGDFGPGENDGLFECLKQRI